VRGLFHDVDVNVNDTMQLKFIPFTSKDDAKKWMYSLPTSSMTNWDGFLQVFLRKYFPNSKTVKE